MATTVGSARSTVRRAIIEILNENVEIETNEVVASVIETVRREGAVNDPVFLREILEVYVADQLRVELRGRRTLSTGHGAIDFEHHEKRAIVLARRIFESVGGTYRKSIPSMNRLELRYSADARRSQAGGLIRWAAFEEALITLLPNDTVTVEEQIDDGTFEALWQFHIGADPA